MCVTDVFFIYSKTLDAFQYFLSRRTEGPRQNSNTHLRITRCVQYLHSENKNSPLSLRRILRISVSLFEHDLDTKTARKTNVYVSQEDKSVDMNVRLFAKYFFAKKCIAMTPRGFPGLPYYATKRSCFIKANWASFAVGTFERIIIMRTRARA